jgi:large subunit ribosomal protein L10
LAISKERKIELLSGYSELLNKSQAVIIATYGGMNMPQFNKVRNQVRDVRADFHVTKNTLIARTFKDAGFNVPSEWLTGSTAVSFCFGDPPAVAKVLGQLSTEIENLKIVGGVVSGQTVDVNGVKELATMPPLDVLRAQIIGAIASSATGVVGVLNAAVGGVMYALQAKIDKEQPADAPAQS